MVATLLFMPAEDTTLSAPPSPWLDGEAHSAQVAAEEAQRLAEAAQAAATIAQAAASSAQQVATVAQSSADKFVDEAQAATARLREACKEVAAVEEKLIQHALK